MDDHVPTIIRLLGKRFGGCTVSPIFRGTWLPDKAKAPEADRSMHIYVYTKQQDDGGTDYFFERLKSRLKRFGRQEEVVVERSEVRLLSAKTLHGPT